MARSNALRTRLSALSVTVFPVSDGIPHPHGVSGLLKNRAVIKALKTIRRNDVAVSASIGYRLDMSHAGNKNSTSIRAAVIQLDKSLDDRMVDIVS